MKTMEYVLTEREFLKEEALNSAKLFIKNLFLFEREVLTKSKYVSYTEIFDRDGNIITVGSGKGYWSDIGSIFEAVEHLIVERCLFDGERRILSSIDWKKQEALVDCVFKNAIVYLSTAMFQCLKYYSPIYENNLWLPICLQNPMFYEDSIFCNSEINTFFN